MIHTQPVRSSSFLSFGTPPMGEGETAFKQNYPEFPLTSSACFSSERDHTALPSR